MCLTWFAWKRRWNSTRLLLKNNMGFKGVWTEPLFETLEWCNFYKPTTRILPIEFRSRDVLIGFTLRIQTPLIEGLDPISRIGF